MKKEKDNIGKLKDCYGCGVCTGVCPVKIIDLKENESGFFAPVITDEDKCINCGLCLKVCGFNHKTLALKENTAPECFAGWSKDEIVRQRCSSGGVGFEVGRKLLEKGYRACGVEYDVEKERAQHYIADNLDNFCKTIGSKYIQSFTQDAFSAINRKEKYLVTGTPCQIDSFRRMIQHYRVEENFILMDFFCHGVPSMLLWRNYLHAVEEKIGKAGFVAWRNKTNGWHDSWNMNIDPIDNKDVDWHNSYNITILEKKHFYQSRWKGGDIFYNFFLGNYCLNTCCYKSCKYKLLDSSADIRIGDLWGTAYREDNLGVNGVIAFTQRGKDLLQELDMCHFESVSAEVATASQMARCPNVPWIHNTVMNRLRSHEPLEKIWKRCVVPYKLTRIPQRAINLCCYKLNLRPIFH